MGQPTREGMPGSSGAWLLWLLMVHGGPFNEKRVSSVQFHSLFTLTPAYCACLQYGGQAVHLNAPAAALQTWQQCVQTTENRI